MVQRSGGTHTRSTPSSSGNTASAAATPTQTRVPDALAAAAPAKPPAAAMPTEQPTAALPTEVPVAPPRSAEAVPWQGARKAPAPPTPGASHHDAHTAWNFTVSRPTNRSGSAPSTLANRQSTVVAKVESPASTTQPRTATDAAVESVARTYSADAPEKQAVPAALSAPLTPSNVTSGGVPNLIAWVGLSPSVSNTPSAPVESPALLAVLAWMRRQYQQTHVDVTPTITKTPVQSSQPAQSVVGSATTAPTPVSSNVAAAAVVVSPAFVQVNAATPQTNQSSVTVTYTSAQVAGNTNILAIGWNNATSNITSVTDSAGNTYQAGGAHRPRYRGQPGDLLRQEHQGRRRPEPIP